MCTGDLPTCPAIHHRHKVPTEDRLYPLEVDYRFLASKWVVVTQTRSSARATSSIHCSAISPSSIHQWRFHAQLLGRKNVLDRGRNWEDEGIQDRERRRGSCWTQECQSACLTSLSKIHLKTGTTSMSIPA